MARPTRSDGPDPDLLRRLREFQVRARRVASPRIVEVVVPARGPLSGIHAGILDRLRRQSTPVADSLEQALTDLNDGSRLSYVGPAGEIREVLRATVQMFAPDEQVRAQSWFVGIRQGENTNPSQSERLRYAVQRRGGDRMQVKGVEELIDELIGEIGRRTYTTGSAAFHAGTQRGRVRRLAGWVFALLDEVLPE
jgi:Predicted pPIWI-associating nuclease